MTFFIFVEKSFMACLHGTVVIVLLQ